MHKKLIATLITAVFAMSMAAGCSDTSSNKRKSDKEKDEEEETIVVELDDYLTYSFDGCDGFAEFTYSVDCAALKEDFDCLEEYSDSDLQEMIMPVLSSTTKEDDAKGYSNGDNITISWALNVDDLEDDYNMEFEDSAVEISVDGLESIPEIDLFDYITVSFSGREPDGEITVEYAEDFPLENIFYTATKDDGKAAYSLSNGEVINLSLFYSGDVKYDSLEAYGLANGYIITTDNKDYTVSGLRFFVNDIEQISDEVVADMEDKAITVITEEVDWGDVTLGNISYEGMYLLKDKTEADKYGEAENLCYIILLVETDLAGEQASVYYWVNFHDLVVNSEGECVVKLSNYEISSKGYSDLDSLYADTIEPLLDNYNGWSTVEQ